MAYQVNATEKVYNFIVEKIKSKEWVQNARIWPESKLCETLGVSRITVRQAIEKLALMGVVRKMRGSGTYVEAVDASLLINAIHSLVSFSSNDFVQLMTFRRFFEYGNVRLFIENYNPQYVAELEESYRLMLENHDNANEYYKYDYAFHNIIAKGTQCSIITQVMQILTDTLIKSLQTARFVTGPEIGKEYHKQILYYIKKKDADMASMFMLRHIEVTLQETQIGLKEKS